MLTKRKEPGYLLLHRSGELAARVERATVLLADCHVCPHACGVNRMAGELGLCRVGAKARVASYGPHFGEESPLVGEHGSGTIFFSGCNLRCVFCQNYDISHIDRRGDQSEEAVDASGLARIMVELQEMGCHNINLVTPSHVAVQVLQALPPAVEAGLRVPLVYNTGGYDAVETLKLLDGVIDIYMPDCKFATESVAERYTAANKYPEVMRAALREMHCQVGDLQLDERGLAVRGLLVRHLVMPGHLEETEAIVRFLAAEISKDTYVNIMDQYRPCGRAAEFSGIDRMLRAGDYERAVQVTREAGLHRLDQKDFFSLLRRLGL